MFVRRRGALKQTRDRYLWSVSVELQQQAPRTRTLEQWSAVQSDDGLAPDLRFHSRIQAWGGFSKRSSLLEDAILGLESRSTGIHLTKSTMHSLNYASNVQTPKYYLRLLCKLKRPLRAKPYELCRWCQETPLIMPESVYQGALVLTKVCLLLHFANYPAKNATLACHELCLC